MPYSELVELALYHREHGFYSTGGQAGRRGDFITSPEVGPLFGQLVANALDAEWDRLGQPAVFTVVDYGAGPGTLARSISASDPRCGDALRYIAIELSIEQRAQHPEWVLSTDALYPEVVGDGLVGVVVANELLDNLAFTPFVRIGDELRLLDVVLEGDQLATIPGPRLSPEHHEVVGPDVDAGVLQQAAATWLTDTLGQMTAGRIIVIDYARTSSADVEIRTYAEHGRAGDPLDALGSKDITVDVDLEQLQRAVRPASSIARQSAWLEGLGLDELVEEGRRLWEEGASTGSLAALKGRSRIREAEALVEVGGLGGFLVAEWVVG